MLRRRFTGQLTGTFVLYKMNDEATRIDSTRDFFDTLATVLIRCWILGVLLLLFSFVVFMLTRGIAANRV